jgi:hypothetical protein
MSDTDPTGASESAGGSSEEGTERSDSVAEPAGNAAEVSPSAAEASASATGAAGESGTDPAGESGAEDTPAVADDAMPASAAAPASPATASPPSPPAAPAKKPRARRSRAVISWILIVLASLLIPISVISAWAIRTVTNTDQYVATMSPLARDPVIVDHLADRATDALFSTGVVQNKVTDVLGPKAKPIITPIVSEVKTYVHGLALKVFESPKFGQLWDALNRHTHEALVSVLEGKHNALLQKIEKNGKIVLNVSPTLQTIIDKANARGITLFNPLKAVLSKGDNGLSVTIVSTEQVSKYSGYFNLLVKLGWWVPVIAVVLGILAIVVAVERRRALLRVAVGVALFTLVILALLAVGRNIFLNKVVQHSYRQDVSAAVWDTLLRYLKTDFRWMLLVSVLVALVAWVFGPARWAVAIRSAFVRAWRWVAGQTHELSRKTGDAAAESSGARRTAGWVAEHVNALRIVGVVVAAGFLLFGGNLTGWSLLVIVIVLAVYLALVQLVVVWARRVSGEPSAPATPGVS